LLIVPGSTQRSAISIQSASRTAAKTTFAAKPARISDHSFYNKHAADKTFLGCAGFVSRVLPQTRLRA